MKRIEDLRIALDDIPGARSEASVDGEVSEEFERYEAIPVWKRDLEPFDRGPRDSTSPFIQLGEDWQVGDGESVIQIIPTEGWDSVSLPIGTVSAIDERVQRRGMDAIGWYVSFHTHRPDWGIHIPVSGIAYLATRAFASLNTSMTTKLTLAFYAIHHHELFHFATDYAMAQAELVHREPWWIPARKAFRQRQCGYCEKDEMLANAYMLQSFRRTPASLNVPGKQAALVDFTRRQPRGYKDAADAFAIGAIGWSWHLDALADQYRQTSRNGAANRLLGLGTSYDWEAQFPIRPRVEWQNCPIYLIDDAASCQLPRVGLFFFASLPAIDESPSFRAKLSNLSPRIQKKWRTTREKLLQGIPNGSDFKPWPRGGKGVYSVRVDLSVRAHLRLDAAARRFTAIEIGHHKEMGHG